MNSLFSNLMPYLQDCFLVEYGFCVELSFCHLNCFIVSYRGWIELLYCSIFICRSNEALRLVLSMSFDLNSNCFRKYKLQGASWWSCTLGLRGILPISWTATCAEPCSTVVSGWFGNTLVKTSCTVRMCIATCPIYNSLAWWTGAGVSSWSNSRTTAF